MTKKLLRLLLLLSLVVLLGVITLKGDEKEEIKEVKNYTSQEMHIFAISSPVYVKNEVLGIKTEKVAEMGKFSEKESKLEEVPVKSLPREERKAYYKKLVEQYDWHHGVALAIIREESQYGHKDWLYNPEGHNGCRGSYGPGQIACLHIGNYGLTWDNVYDPEANVRAMYLLWKEQGFKPWGVCHIQNGVRKVRCW